MEHITPEIDEDEIESHLAANNRFFQGGSFRAADLDFYAAPLHAVVQAVKDASDGYISMDQARKVMDKAISEYRALDAALEAENEQEAT